MKESTKTFFSDHSNGKKAEELSLPALQTLTKHPLIHIKDLFAPWDFESSGTVIEHKSREVCYSDYKETMLDYLKVKRAVDERRKVWYAFRFLDGLYVIKYNKDLFNTFRRETKEIESRVDYQEVPRERIYIPIHLLRCLEKYERTYTALFLDD